MASSVQAPSALAFAQTLARAGIDGDHLQQPRSGVVERTRCAHLAHRSRPERARKPPAPTSSCRRQLVETARGAGGPAGWGRPHRHRRKQSDRGAAVQAGRSARAAFRARSSPISCRARASSRRSTICAPKCWPGTRGLTAAAACCSIPAMTAPRRRRWGAHRSLGFVGIDLGSAGGRRQARAISRRAAAEPEPRQDRIDVVATSESDPKPSRGIAVVRLPECPYATPVEEFSSMTSRSVARSQSLRRSFPRSSFSSRKRWTSGRFGPCRCGGAKREMALVRAYGLRDAEAGLKATTDTQFLIGSITKSFTSTASRF